MSDLKPPIEKPVADRLSGDRALALERLRKIRYPDIDVEQL